MPIHMQVRIAAAKYGPQGLNMGDSLSAMMWTNVRPNAMRPSEASDEINMQLGSSRKAGHMRMLFLNAKLRSVVHQHDAFLQKLFNNSWCVL